MVMTRLSEIVGLLDTSVSPPPALGGSSASGLTFDPPIHLGVDPCVDLPVGLVLLGGAYGVPQVPVPQTCQPHAQLVTSN